MVIEAVIGANYGDEGKGLFTEHLCRNRPSPLVVLSNGGSQRGHTVNRPDLGIRHVFHHFGSGTLHGTPSVFSKTFLMNPITYVSEKRQLQKHGIAPRTYRAPGCIFQLPVDMFINQALETHRTKYGTQHGSCGWGIWETILRSRSCHFQTSPLTVEAFAAMDYDAKRRRFLDDTEQRVCLRLAEADIPYDSNVLDKIMSDGFIRHFISDFEEMASDSKLLETDKLLANDYGFDVKTFIVENGQGLLLNQKYAPAKTDSSTDIHTTPSETGCLGVMQALGLSKPKLMTLNYITRSYFTRHGAGPFPEHTYGKEFPDETNKPNQYQGTLRFGELTKTCMENLVRRVRADVLDTVPASIANIVMTHCNEVMLDSYIMGHVKYISSADDSSEVKENAKRLDW